MLFLLLLLLLKQYATYPGCVITYLHARAAAGLVQLDATNGTAIFLRELCLFVAGHLKEIPTMQQ